MFRVLGIYNFGSTVGVHCGPLGSFVMLFRQILVWKVTCWNVSSQINQEDYEHYEDEHYEDEHYEDENSGSGDVHYDEHYDEESCQSGFKQTTIEIFYCAEDAKYIRKCCDKNMNINPKGESCTDHLVAKNDTEGEHFKSLVKPYLPLYMVNENSQIIIDDEQIFYMEKSYLSVTTDNHDFELIESSGRFILKYNNREFQEVSKIFHALKIQNHFLIIFLNKIFL